MMLVESENDIKTQAKMYINSCEYRGIPPEKALEYHSFLVFLLYLTSIWLTFLLVYNTHMVFKTGDIDMLDVLALLVYLKILDMTLITGEGGIYHEDVFISEITYIIVNQTNCVKRYFGSETLERYTDKRVAIFTYGVCILAIGVIQYLTTFILLKSISIWLICILINIVVLNYILKDICKTLRIFY